MSADAQSEQGPSAESVLDTFQRLYHIPALVLVVGYMLWVRFLPYDRFVQDDSIYFAGNDAYYHFRTTSYSIANWPRRLYAEPWTNFPYGTNQGQFGTLFDQFFATIALIVGLGDPTEQQIAMIALAAPPILGGLCAIPTYFVGKHVSESRLGGVVAAGVLALIPQAVWLTRGMVGFYDHHVAETLLMTVTIFAMMVALTVVQRERPVYEQVVDQDWQGLRPSIKYSALAGVALALYMLTWAAGVVLVGILGTFFVLALSIEVIRGNSPEHVAFAGAVSTGVAGVLLLPFVQSFSFETTTLSLLQVLITLSVGVTCVVMAAMARTWEREQIQPQTYPVAVGSIGLVAILFMWFVLPEVLSQIWNNVQRIMFLGQSDTALTVGEAQSMDLSNLGLAFYGGYGFTFVTGVVALALLGGRVLLSQRPRPEYLLLVVWTVFLTLMSITQQRFHYYLVVPVAVLNGWLIVRVLEVVDYPELTAPGEIETYHVLVLAAIVLVVVFPLTVAPGAAVSAPDVADQHEPGEVVVWDDGLEFLEGNTPAAGEYGGADDEMEYYQTAEPIDDYESPEGAYGVMSWWDYGHWITVRGERIPNANPFQQGAEDASSYFQATDEERANQYLDALPADPDQRLDRLSDEELETLIDGRTDQEINEETRFVMIDDQMAGNKFPAITQWAGPGTGTYVDRQEIATAPEEQQLLQTTSDQYEDTMVARLYLDDAEGLEHYRLVHEADQFSYVGSIAQTNPRTGDLQASWLRSFQLQFEGWNNDTELFSRQLQQANQQNQAVPLDELGTTLAYNGHIASTVKTYERVEGATITGEAEPNQTVTAIVPMEANTGREFQYTQQATVDEDGTFELTVPYATTNERGPEDGYTDTAVEANGTYTVYTGEPFPEAVSEDVEVPESAIYDGETIEVELEALDAGPTIEVDDDESDAAEDGETDDGEDGDADGADDENADGSGEDTSDGESTGGEESTGDDTAGESVPVSGALVA